MNLIGVTAGQVSCVLLFGDVVRAFVFPPSPPPAPRFGLRGFVFALGIFFPLNTTLEEKGESVIWSVVCSWSGRGKPMGAIRALLAATRCSSTAGGSAPVKSFLSNGKQTVPLFHVCLLLLMLLLLLFLILLLLLFPLLQQEDGALV